MSKYLLITGLQAWQINTKLDATTKGIEQYVIDNQIKILLNLDIKYDMYEYSKNSKITTIQYVTQLGNDDYNEETIYCTIPIDKLANMFP